MIKKVRITKGPGHRINQIVPAYSPYEMSEPSAPGVKNTLQPVESGTGNLEAEKGEQAYVPDVNGLAANYRIGGKRHAQGGTELQLPDDSFIFSDTSSLKLKGDIVKYFGKGNTKKSYTPADLAKQYDINKYRKVLGDPASDKLQRDTAETMIGEYNKKLGALALVQESQKGFPDGIPQMAIPFLMSAAIDPSQVLPLKGQPGDPSQDNPQQGPPPMAEGGFVGYGKNGTYQHYQSTNPWQNGPTGYSAYGGELPQAQTGYSMPPDATRTAMQHSLPPPANPTESLWEQMKREHPYDPNAPKPMDTDVPWWLQGMTGPGKIALGYLGMKGAQKLAPFVPGAIKAAAKAIAKAAPYIGKAGVYAAKNWPETGSIGYGLYSGYEGEEAAYQKHMEDLAKADTTKAPAINAFPGDTLRIQPQPFNKDSADSYDAYIKSLKKQTGGLIKAQNGYSGLHPDQKGNVVDSTGKIMGPDPNYKASTNAMNTPVKLSRNAPGSSSTTPVKGLGPQHAAGLPGEYFQDWSKNTDKDDDWSHFIARNSWYFDKHPELKDITKFTGDSKQDPKTGQWISSNVQDFQHAWNQLPEEQKFHANKIKHVEEDGKLGILTHGIGMGAPGAAQAATTTQTKGRADINQVDYNGANWNHPTDWWLQDKIKAAGALGDFMRIHKYLPWGPPAIPVTPEATFSDPTRELAANAEMAGMGTRGASAFAGPQGYALDFSAIQGQAGKQAADILAKYNNFNVGQADKQQEQRANILTKTNEYNAANAKDLYDKTTIANQQYDNARNQARQELRSGLIDAVTNRAQTQALNYMHPYGYQVYPGVGGDVHFTPTPGHQLPATGYGEGSSDPFSQAVELKKKYPDMNWSEALQAANLPQREELEQARAWHAGFPPSSVYQRRFPYNMNMNYMNQGQGQAVPGYGTGSVDPYTGLPK